jgi:MSHA biogenesis protein MshP
MNMRRAPRRQQGFLIIAAVFLLVVLAGLVAYLTSVSTTSQAASAADLNSSRAYQAARTGAEWASYLLLQTAGGVGTLKTDCEPGPTTKSLVPGSTLAGFTVSVTCSSTTYTEGAATGPTAVRVYSIRSNACNEPDAGVCPNNTTTAATYVDRQVILTITN